MVSKEESIMKNMGKKKLLMITGGILGLLVLITIILLIYNAIFGKTSYKDIENKVLKAAQKYYSDNQSLLPKNEHLKISEIFPAVIGWVSSFWGVSIYTPRSLPMSMESLCIYNFLIYPSLSGNL